LGSKEAAVLALLGVQAGRRVDLALRGGVGEGVSGGRERGKGEGVVVEGGWATGY
jgi:hypothetical protein